MGTEPVDRFTEPSIDKIWVPITAFSVFLVGICLYVLTGYGHFFALGLGSVALIAWRYGRSYGMAGGAAVAATSTVLTLARSVDPSAVLRDNSMYLVMALGVGSVVGYLSDTNRELRAAYREIRLLQGFIPICCSCKKVREDDGYWTQVEEYVSQRTDAQFSHGFCPDCLEELVGVDTASSRSLTPPASVSSDSKPIERH